MNKRAVGLQYEQLAVDYLKQQNYEILERNFYTHAGEIDLIARDGTAIVFIEVKYRSSKANGFPQEAVTQKKQQRMIRSAQYYLYHNHMENIPCRFDVIAILGKEISHIQNAFEVS
jgi:putative endonuclease